MNPRWPALLVVAVCVLGCRAPKKTIKVFADAPVVLGASSPHRVARSDPRPASPPAVAPAAPSASVAARAEGGSDPATSPATNETDPGLIIDPNPQGQITPPPGSLTQSAPENVAGGSPALVEARSNKTVLAAAPIVQPGSVAARDEGGSATPPSGSPTQSAPENVARVAGVVCGSPPSGGASSNNVPSANGVPPSNDAARYLNDPPSPARFGAPRTHRALQSTATHTPVSLAVPASSTPTAKPAPRILSLLFPAAVSTNSAANAHRSASVPIPGGAVLPGQAAASRVAFPDSTTTAPLPEPPLAKPIYIEPAFTDEAEWRQWQLARQRAEEKARQTERDSLTGGLQRFLQQGARVSTNP